MFACCSIFAIHYSHSNGFSFSWTSLIYFENKGKWKNFTLELQGKVVQVLLEQFVHEFLHVYLGENNVPFMNWKNVVSKFSFAEKLYHTQGKVSCNLCIHKELSSIYGKKYVEITQSLKNVGTAFHSTYFILHTYITLMLR